MFVLVMGREPVVRGFQSELAPLARGLRADGVNARVRKAAQYECMVPTLGECMAALRGSQFDTVHYCPECGGCLCHMCKCGR